MPRLDHHTALITGAARGIGAAIAEAFVREGAQVIVSDIDDDAGQQTADALDALYFHLDVAAEGDWAAFEHYAAAERLPLTVVVNNAGITGLGETEGPYDPEQFHLDAWRRVMAVNADGTALGCRTALRLLKARGGSIINISSRSGVVGIPGAAAYAASKAAIRNHTKSVALYAAEQGYHIRCNSLHPAAILTPMWDAMLGDDPSSRQAALDVVAAGIPMGHLGTPDDVAHAAVFLASDESRYITGSEITIDGGILAGASAAPGKRGED